MNPTKTGLYTTTADGRTLLLYWDGEDWIDQDGIRPCYKKVHWTGKPLFVPALRTWVGLTYEERKSIREWRRIQDELGPMWAPMMLYLYEAIEAKLKEKNT